jgi:hypothetical protein
MLPTTSTRNHATRAVTPKAALLRARKVSFRGLVPDDGTDDCRRKKNQDQHFHLQSIIE